MKFLTKISNKFNLEYMRCKKIAMNHNAICACFLLIKKFSISTISLFVALMIIAIRPFLKIYLVRLNSSRMGHFALSTEILLAQFELHPERRRGKILFFYLRFYAANQQLLKMCKRSFFILPFARICYYTDVWLCRILGKKYETDFVKSFEHNTALVDLDGLFKRTNPHLSFTKNELDHGKFLIEKLG